MPIKALASGMMMMAMLGLTPGSAKDAPVPQTAPTAAPGHHVYLIGPLRVTQARISPAGSGSDAADGYVLIENRGAAPDHLIGASFRGVASVTLAGSGDGDPAPEAGLLVPGSGTLRLGPGSAHIVLRGLADAGANGEPVPGTIRFARAGSLQLSFDPGDTTESGDDPASSQRPVDLAQ